MRAPPPQTPAPSSSPPTRRSSHSPSTFPLGWCTCLTPPLPPSQPPTPLPATERALHPGALHPAPCASWPRYTQPSESTPGEAPIAHTHPELCTMGERQSPACIQDPLGLVIGPGIHTPCPHSVFTLQVHTFRLHPRSTLQFHILHPHTTSTLCPHPTSAHIPAWPSHGDPRDTQGANAAHRMSEVRL